MYLTLKHIFSCGSVAIDANHRRVSPLYHLDPVPRIDIPHLAATVGPFYCRFLHFYPCPTCLSL